MVGKPVAHSNAILAHSEKGILSKRYTASIQNLISCQAFNSKKTAQIHHCIYMKALKAINKSFSSLINKHSQHCIYW